MRQAGRYLPEYRELRQRAGGFLDLCFTPELAAKATLQPVRRFAVDGAILFSDILVIPHALGQEVSFVEGEGPRLALVRSAAAVDGLSPSSSETSEDLLRVYEAVVRVRDDLPDTVALIGFAGGPWTVACYMVEGQGSPTFHAARRMMLEDPAAFGRLIDRLVEMTASHLIGQIRAGAEVVQIFESHAGVLSPDAFREMVIAPTRRIIDALRTQAPEVPVIGFPRGAGMMYGEYAHETGITALSVDTSVPLDRMLEILPPGMPLQGNLDPAFLLCGGAALRKEASRIAAFAREHPLVFNLGHGVDKETDPEHIANLVATLRSESESSPEGGS